MLEMRRRFTTYERIDEMPYMSLRSGRRERFERQKMLFKACLNPAKNPRSHAKLESHLDEIEGVFHEATELELTTTDIVE